MDPAVSSHGMKADPPRYLWSKYECFLMSGWWDIPHSSCFNVKLWSNSTNGTKLRTNIRMDERKDENNTPLGINARGIIKAKAEQQQHIIKRKTLEKNPENHAVNHYLSHITRKPVFRILLPAKTLNNKGLIKLCKCASWSVPLLFTWHKQVFWWQALSVFFGDYSRCRT